MGRRSLAGYLAAVAGSLVGAASLGALLGWAFASLSSDGLEAVGMMAVGVMLGAYVGSVLGCWAALRILRIPASNGTAVVLAVLAPIGIGAGIWLGILANGQATLAAGLLGGVALSAVAARLLGPLLGDDARSGGAALRGSPTVDRPNPAPWEAEEPFGAPR